MNESRHCFCYPSHVPVLDTFMEVLPDPCDPQRVTVTLVYVHVVSGPLLDKSGKECSRKAEHETNDPDDIHPDIRR